jgi:hypothetical protein
LALVYESPDLWEIVEIDTVSAGSISLLFVVENTYTNAKVMPARLGLISNGITKVGTGYSAVTTIRYNITDNLALTAASAPAQFLGDDVYFDEILMSGRGGTYKKSLVTQVNSIDYDLGLFDKLNPFLHNRLTVNVSNLVEGKADIRSFKRLLERRAGRKGQYWEPSFEADMVTTSVGAITTTMNVEIIGQTDWSEQRTHIAVQDTSGNWLPRTILSFTQLSGSLLQLELDVSLGIDAEDIAVISYLGLKRFDTDRIEIKWLGNNVVESVVKVLEIAP